MKTADSHENYCNILDTYIFEQVTNFITKLLTHIYTHNSLG